ncbi:MAG: multidrug efflux SMR transporter [Helicobacteraceae bacterium]|jgi:small multidrug resistance pump|nr:multidrug efflux SMR transporter [Helicobacteraceae bacterium]
MKSYLFLALAIAFELIGTTALASSKQFTKITPIVVMVVAYIASFYCLSLSIRTIPIGIAYAIWSGVGTALIALVGALAFKQAPDAPALIGIALILAGTATINLFSKTAAH